MPQLEPGLNKHTDIVGAQPAEAVNGPRPRPATSTPTTVLSCCQRGMVADRHHGQKRDQRAQARDATPSDRPLDPFSPPDAAPKYRAAPRQDTRNKNKSQPVRGIGEADERKPPNTRCEWSVSTSDGGKPCNNSRGKQPGYKRWVITYPRAATHQTGTASTGYQRLRSTARTSTT